MSAFFTELDFSTFRFRIFYHRDVNTSNGGTGGTNPVEASL